MRAITVIFLIFSGLAWPALTKDSHVYRKFRFGTEDEQVSVVRSLTGERYFSNGTADEQRIAADIYRKALSSGRQKLILTATNSLVYQREKRFNDDILKSLKHNFETFRDDSSFMTQMIGSCSSLQVTAASSFVLSIYKKINNNVIRQSILEEIGGLAPEGDKRVGDFLYNTYQAITTRSDKDQYEMKISALASLGEIKDPRTYKIAIQQLKKSGEKGMEGAAASALGHLGDRRAIPFLLNHLKTPRHFTVKRKVIGALIALKAPQVYPLVMRYMRSNTDPMRIYAVNTISQVNRPLQEDLIEMLRYKAENDSAFRVKKGARRALLELYKKYAVKKRPDDLATNDQEMAMRKKILTIFDNDAFKPIYGELEKMADETIPASERGLIFRAVVSSDSFSDRRLKREVTSFIRSEYSDDTWETLLKKAAKNRDQMLFTMLFRAYRGHYGFDALKNKLAVLLTHQNMLYRVYALREMDRLKLDDIGDTLIGVIGSQEFLKFRKPKSRLTSRRDGKHTYSSLESDEFVKAVFIYLRKYGYTLTAPQKKALAALPAKLRDDDYSTMAEKVVKEVNRR